MTLGAGAIFGLVEGVILASIASTIGATLAMLAARLIARDWVMRKYPATVAKVDEGVRKDGALYLLSLRLAPVFPFFVVNLVMGLTAMPVLRYAALTMLGAFPGTMVFTFAGTALAQVKSLGDVVSAPLLGAFLGLAVLPLIGKATSGWLRDRKALRRWQRPRKFDANLIVIGAGSAGLVASYAAAALKSRVILIEAAEMGGDCLNTGCVPSKALIRAGKAAAEVRKAGRFGIDADLRGVRFADVVGHIRGAITAIAPHDSVERFTGLGVDVRQARATIIDPWTVALDDGERLTARSILLATGAHPAVPPIPGLAESGFVTSETLWDRLATFDRPPERVVLLGGGAIGCEIAQALARLGSQVALVEQAERLLAKEEPEAAIAVSAALTGRWRPPGPRPRRRAGRGGRGPRRGGRGAAVRPADRRGRAQAAVRGAGAQGARARRKSAGRRPPRAWGRSGTGSSRGMPGADRNSPISPGTAARSRGSTPWSAHG